MNTTIENEVQFEELTEKEARELKEILTKFIKSYSQKNDTISDKEWLKSMFREELPDCTEEQADKLAEETVSSIKEYDKNLASINEAAKNGTSKEQWMAEHISKASVGVAVNQYGEYLNKINNTLTNANAQMLRTVTAKNGEISQCYNLDGFIAEQYHVNTFNANAALQKSKYFAEVKVPEADETYGKNSFDIVIRDSSNPKATAVHQYQVKYGSDAKATIQMLRDHGEITKYSNQQIVVPAEQLEEVQKAFPGKTVVSHIGGTDKVPVTSDTLTKEQAKALQLKVQDEKLPLTTEWNVFQTKELALQIGRNAGLAGVQAAAMTTGFSLAAQVIAGEGVDVDETVEQALKTGADAGVKAAASGALVIAHEEGILRLIPAGTPATTIANLACVSIENIKILSKLATGELTMTQALDQMGRTSISMYYSLGWGATGMLAGATVLSWIPVVGPAIGGILGGLIGGMAGSKFGETVYNGIKAVGKGIGNICKTGWNKAKSVASKIRKKIRW